MKFVTPLFIFMFLSIMADCQVKPLHSKVLSPYPNNRDFTILKKEAYFSAQSPMGEISVIMKLNKKPKIASFSGKFMDLEPFLTSDGLTLYFASNRPLDESSQETKDFDIWYVKRKNTKSEWENPINLGLPINSEANEFYASVSHNGSVYFTSDRTDGSKGKDDIYVSRLSDGHFQSPVSLSSAINSDGYEFNAFIAPDESFLLFTGYNRPDGLGSGDLYISLKGKNNEWQKAVNLGPEINSDKMDYCPFVDLNGQLYFTSKRSNIDRSKEFNSTSELLKVINMIENGLSRIYSLKFNPSDFIRN